MLTFFEYLRQRSFESVLSGAQQALRLLEEEKQHDQPGGAESQIPECKAPFLEGRLGDAPAADSSQEKLPAPRRRGRPRKREANGQ